MWSSMNKFFIFQNLLPPGHQFLSFVLLSLSPLSYHQTIMLMTHVAPHQKFPTILFTKLLTSTSNSLQLSNQFLISYTNRNFTYSGSSSFRTTPSFKSAWHDHPVPEPDFQTYQVYKWPNQISTSSSPHGSTPS
jgi:hypothetical protein